MSSEPIATRARDWMKGGPQFRASMIPTFPLRGGVSSIAFGTWDVRSPTETGHREFRQKNITELINIPVGDVEFPTYAAYPRFTTTEPRSEVGGACGEQQRNK